jgi:hypothetical protein
MRQDDTSKRRYTPLSVGITAFDAYACVPGASMDGSHLEARPNTYRSSTASVNVSWKWEFSHAQQGLRVVSILIYRVFLHYTAPEWVFFSMHKNNRGSLGIWTPHFRDIAHFKASAPNYCSGHKGTAMLIPRFPAIVCLEHSVGNARNELGTETDELRSLHAYLH